MRTAVLVLCLLLVSKSTYSQTESTKEPPVFDKKFWTAASILIGSSIILTEASVHRNQSGRFDTRLKIYTAHGISDFLIFAVSANLKSDGKKWWWIAPIAASAVNGGFAIKYSKSF